jgi:DNA-binding transcriptional ArsR family regulator
MLRRAPDAKPTGLRTVFERRRDRVTDGASRSDGNLRDESQRMTPTLIRALSHPLRRKVLRMLHRSGEDKSPAQLSERIGENVSTVNYQMNALANMSVLRRTEVRKVRGFKQNFFASEVSEHKQIALILADTEKDDER